MSTSPFTRTPGADGSIIVRSGKQLTIENCADFALCLHEAMVESPRVAVEFTPEVEVDLTTLQILCSACKTAAAEGKSFTRLGSRPDQVTHLITAAGAERLGSCNHNNGNMCLWFGGN